MFDNIETVIEAIVIIGIIILQLVLAYRLWEKIIQYRDIFNLEHLPVIKQKYISKKTFEEGSVAEILEFKIDEDQEIENPIEIIYLENISDSYVLTTIVKYINVYLIRNRGASIDFHLIKDIVEKHTITIENQIENRIPAPLYLGLAATMLGIIIGLFTVDFNNAALDAIQPLINGVKWAMSASVIGLIITTWFSIQVYKGAQTEADEEKNEFLSKLQAELMPKMGKGKLPEVSILSNKLDKFARTTTGAISGLDVIVENSKTTVQHERQLISEIRELDIAAVTSANVEVFTNLDQMMDSFQSFAKYYEELDKSMLSTSDLLSNLKQFVSSTQNINIILEEIKGNIKQSNEAVTFFNKHIRSFEKYNDAVNEAVANNDSAFRAAVIQLTSATEKQYEAFTELVSKFDSKLSDAFTSSVENFTNAMDEQVRRTEQAFEAGRPKFEKLENLDKLNKLEVIEERLLKIEEQLYKAIDSGNVNIVSALTKLNKSVNDNSATNNSLASGDVDYEGTKHIKIERPKKTIFNYFETAIKIGAYTIIIVYGIYYALNYFNLVS